MELFNASMELMKNIVGNLKSMNVMKMNFDVLMDNVYLRVFSMTTSMLLIVLMVLMNIPVVILCLTSPGIQLDQYLNWKKYHVSNGIV
jgi:hypothetical protein